MIFGGDFKQTLPVIPKGSDLDTISNCMKKSLLWKLFDVISLTQNMRCDPNELRFISWLRDIGNGITG